MYIVTWPNLKIFVSEYKIFGCNYKLTIFSLSDDQLTTYVFLGILIFLYVFEYEQAADVLGFPLRVWQTMNVGKKRKKSYTYNHFHVFYDPDPLLNFINTKNTHP